MTLRELHGWSPSTVTVDADGNVLSVTVCEPRFTLVEREALLASRRAERAPRGSHGRLLSEVTDPNVEWVVPNPTRDYAKQKLSRVQEEYRKAWPDADHDSLLWTVKSTQD